MAQYGVEYILHTQPPRFLAKVTPEDNLRNFEIVDEIDSFSDYPPEKIAGLMNRMFEWFTKYCEWEENNAQDMEDEEDFEEVEIKEPNLEDAHAMSLIHGSTFKVPTNKEIQSLKTGSLVKVCASGERFWVKVMLVDRSGIIGEVDNELVNSDRHGLFLDDTIKLYPHNIYQIHQE